MNLLIDTHVFLWMMTDKSRLSRPALSALSDTANRRWVSAVVAWELAIKASIHKLELTERVAFFVLDGMQKAKATEFAVTVNHANAVAGLPHHHTDPFDRMLIAQCQVESFSLVTADSKMKGYGVPILW